MQTRRNFIGNVATGLACTLRDWSCSGGQRTRPHRHHRRGRSRHSAGPRGQGLPGNRALRLRRHLQRAASKTLCEAAPAARNLTPDYRAASHDPALDAVLIATPQHLHAEGPHRGHDAGKHVYIEKAMAFNVRASQTHAGRVQKGRKLASSRSATRRARSATWRTLQTISPRASSAR